MRNTQSKRAFFFLSKALSGLAFVASVTPIAAAASTPNQSEPEPPPPWDERFEVVEIPSSADGSIQKAYAFQSRSSQAAPLVVSLHSWSGDYTQRDPLAETFAAEDFNYIHPDFRGTNTTPESCASPVALQDIDDAIAYCLTNWNVDPSRIVLVGASGGGHAVCAAYFKSKHPIRAFHAWVPISDIEAWYYQVKQRELKYKDEILAILGGELDTANARQRSPLYMEPIPKRKGKIHLYAGIKDGYTGSVPISQSILLFNRLCEATNERRSRVGASKIVALLSRAAKPTGQGIDDRDIYLLRQASFGSLTIFEGGHEMLVDYCADTIIEDVTHENAR